MKSLIIFGQSAAHRFISLGPAAFFHGFDELAIAVSNSVAIMHPNVIPPETRKNPIRSAECKVFDELKNVLPDEYHVFYSSPWLGTFTWRGWRSRFHHRAPREGLLAVKLKEGRIEIEHGTKLVFNGPQSNQIQD